MTRTNNKLLKVTGILMIISGGIGIFVGIFTMIGLSVFTEAIDVEMSIGVLVLATILTIGGAIVNITTGILGVVNASKPEKAMICIIFGVLALALVLLTNIIDFVSGSGFNVKSLLRGVLLPVLFIMGAYQNQKLVA